MQNIRDWIKQVAFCMCFLELLYQLVPGKSWRKYLQFTGGLIFILVLTGPVLQVLSLGEPLKTSMWKWEIQEKGMELQEAQKELTELQNSQINNVFCQETQKQIDSIVVYYGGKAKNITVTAKSGEPGAIEKAEILLEEPMDKTRKRACMAVLMAYLNLKEEQIIIQTEKEGQDG